jgi:serine/threonine protein kinase
MWIDAEFQYSTLTRAFNFLGSLNFERNRAISMELCASVSHELLREARIFLYREGFNVIRPLGNGGFAHIFEVESRRYGETFAVKVIDLGLDANCTPTSFEAEINSLRQLNHPNVIRIYNYFRSESLVYIILELCPGGSIRDVLRNQGPIRPPLLYELCRQLLGALARCHMFDIAHRDVKPSNILIDRYGRAKLADFGLSCQVRLTPTEQAAGSLPYLPPEFFLGEVVDPRMLDVWSLGVTFYQMATNSLPWNTADMKAEILAGNIPYPATIPIAFREILQGMLVLKPEARMTCEQLLAQDVFKKPETATTARRNILTRSESTEAQLTLLRPLARRRKSGGGLAHSAPATFAEEDFLTDYRNS